jgi:hypothetical protein
MCAGMLKVEASSLKASLEEVRVELEASRNSLGKSDEKVEKLQRFVQVRK